MRAVYNTRREDSSRGAMALLAKAVKAGYKDTAQLKKDADLDPLREREDFKTLLAELEKTANAGENKP